MSVMFGPMSTNMGPKSSKLDQSQPFSSPIALFDPLPINEARC